VAPSNAAAKGPSGAIIFVLLAALAACGDDPAPLPPVIDSGFFNPDGSTDSGGEGGVTPRPDGGARLPPADIEVTLPYEGAEAEVSLTVAADAAQVDIHLSVDTTGSFSQEIDRIQSELLERVLPPIRDRVGDVGVGVSRFEDFPVLPYGGPTDAPFTLLSGITTSGSRVGAAVAGLDDPLGFGGDGPEASAEALYQIATGEGFTAGGTRYVAAYSGRSAPGGGDLGGVGFRDDSLRAVVHITDAPAHRAGDYLPRISGAHSLDAAIASLTAQRVSVLGIASGAAARPHLERVALATGAVSAPLGDTCPTGIDGGRHSPVDGVCPLVFDVDPAGTGLSTTLVDALLALLDSVRYEEVYGIIEEDDFGFVKAVEATTARVPPGAEDPVREDRRPSGDGIVDTFVGVRPGSELTFRARLHNDRIPGADYDQVFRVTVAVYGDDLLLARRVVRITVPRGRVFRDAGVDGSVADAGMDAAISDAGADGSIADAGMDAAISDAGVDGSLADAGMDAAISDGAISDASADSLVGSTDGGIEDGGDVGP